MDKLVLLLLSAHFGRFTKSRQLYPIDSYSAANSSEVLSSRCKVLLNMVAFFFESRIIINYSFRVAPLQLSATSIIPANSEMDFSILVATHRTAYFPCISNKGPISIVPFF
jgi:hypothetical protein